PSWLAIDPADKFLFVSDEQPHGAGRTLYVINIDPFDKDNYQKVWTKTLLAPDVPTHGGLRGLAVTSDGKFLMIAAPDINAAVGSVSQSPGKIVVIDLRNFKPADALRVAQSIAVGIDLYAVTATVDAKKVTFTNRRDDAIGFGVLTSDAAGK